MASPTILARRSHRFYRIEIIFVAAAFLAAYLPFWPVASWLQTYMLPWRAELVASSFALAGLVWAYRSASFTNFIANLSGAEYWAIIIPIAAFATWSFASLAWANSPVSVLHHSFSWIVYLAFYMLLRPQLAAGKHIRSSIFIASVFVVVLCVPPVVTYYGFLVSGGTASIALGYSKWAEVVNALLPLIAVFALSPRRRISIAALAVVALVWFFDIATLRRTAIGIFPVAILAVVAAVYVFEHFRRYRPQVKYLIGVLAVVPLIAYSVSLVGRVEDPAVSRMNDWTVETSNKARVHLARIGIEMFLSRPMTGVGGDNFGYEFRRFNEAYAEAHPEDQNLSAMEIGTPGRAHNEFVQILAEEGVVGFALFTWTLVGFAYFVFSEWRRRRGLPFVTVGAMIGIGAFLASSVVSSYSFRSTQNGIIFFFLLASAIASLTQKSRRGVEDGPGHVPGARLFKPAVAFGMAACLGMIFLSTWRAAGVYMAHRAIERGTFEETMADFELSLRIDSDNAAVHSTIGRFLIGQDRASEAVPYFRRAVDLGRATPADYSYLATAHIMAGDLHGARDALAEATRTYPFSVFLRTRYGAVLTELSESDEADRQFAAAVAQNEPHARSWRNLVTLGADKAARIAFQQKLPALMELQPTPAVYAMVTERELRFPEERNIVPY